jgi:hypothetical protein
VAQTLLVKRAALVITAWAEPEVQPVVKRAPVTQTAVAVGLAGPVPEAQVVLAALPAVAGVAEARLLEPRAWVVEVKFAIPIQHLP